MSRRGVVAAGHELTAQAAARTLAEGGNAFDAALAAMCAASATEPVLTSLGGGGFLLALPAHGPCRVYDFFVHTPLERRPPAELDFHPVTVDFGAVQQAFNVGHGSIATPGVVKGMFAVHRELGHMPMREIVAPAIDYARDGVELNALQAYIFRIVEPIYTWSPAARAIFGSPKDAGRMVGEGETLRQTELADLLEVLAIEGEDLFYRGEVAQTIVEQCRGQGGCLTRHDLEHYRVELREPLEVEYGGVQVLANPPPSSGGILIGFALRLLDRIEELREAAFGSHGHLRRVALALEATAQARVDAHIDQSTAYPDAAQLLDENLLERYRVDVRHHARATRGTTHMSIIDADDNVAALTVSNGEGCGHIVPGTGVMLNNMLGEEDLNPHGFHRWKPDQRMTSMMSPSILRWPDGRIVATGSGGSKRIRTALLQVIVNLIDHGMAVAPSVESPRIFFEDGKLSVEGGFRAEEVDRLLEDYPRHQVWNELNLYFGGAHTVGHGASGFYGAGDPRRGGVSIVV